MKIPWSDAIEFLPTVIYIKSRMGMSKHLKVLKTKLSRCGGYETMKREQLIIRIGKLKNVITDMRLVIHMAEGLA